MPLKKAVLFIFLTDNPLVQKKKDVARQSTLQVLISSDSASLKTSKSWWTVSSVSGPSHSPNSRLISKTAWDLGGKGQDATSRRRVRIWSRM